MECGPIPTTTVLDSSKDCQNVNGHDSDHGNHDISVIEQVIRDSGNTDSEIIVIIDDNRDDRIARTDPSGNRHDNSKVRNDTPARRQTSSPPEPTKTTPCPCSITTHEPTGTNPKVTLYLKTTSDLKSITPCS